MRIREGWVSRRTSVINQLRALLLERGITVRKAALRDANGKPVIAQVLSDNDRKLAIDALLKHCDARDGVADGMKEGSQGQCRWGKGLSAGSKQRCRSGLPARLKSAGKSEARELA